MAPQKTGNLTALVVLADGSEEIEAVTIANVLVRGGVKVTLASVGKTTIEGSRGIRIQADTTLESLQNEAFDLIALPGGMPGAEHLRDSTTLIQMLKDQKASGRLIGAICASPAVVLEHQGLLKGEKACCYPCFKLKPEHATECQNARVVTSNNIVTSVGPASAMEFALKLVERLQGRETAVKIAQGLLVSTQHPASASPVE